jgi:rhodanese-related sulfurtransferase
MDNCNQQDECRLSGSTLVPPGTLRSRPGGFPRDRDMVFCCRLSVRGYEAVPIMQAAGLSMGYVPDGGTIMWPYESVRGK